MATTQTVTDAQLMAALNASPWARMQAPTSIHAALQLAAATAPNAAIANPVLTLEQFMDALTCSPWHRLEATCTEVRLDGSVDVTVAV
jgi:hypothetical protein